MTRQFGRVVEVHIGPPGELGRKITGLRTAFDASKDEDAATDRCAITLWNPSPDTIRLLETQGTYTRLLAGYGTPVQVAAGDTVVDSLRVEKTGPDRVVTWSIRDGGLQLDSTFISQAWATGVSADTVLRTLAASAGLAVGVIVASAATYSYPDGYVAYGSLRSPLIDIASDLGAVWVIQDNALSVYPRGGDKRTPMAVISAQSGMIGSPVARANKRLEVTALLLPSMRPGQPFRVTSNVATGDLIATDVQHRGDSGYDVDFYTTIVGRPRSANGT